MKIDNNDMDVKTSAQHLKDHPDIIIYDPDGWDRKNYEYSFNEELISEDEFMRRLCMSTIIFKML